MVLESSLYPVRYLGRLYAVGDDTRNVGDDVKRLIWQVRYTLLAHKHFGWRTAWYFSKCWAVENDYYQGGAWVDYTPDEAVYEDLVSSL